MDIKKMQSDGIFKDELNVVKEKLKIMKDMREWGRYIG